MLRVVTVVQQTMAELNGAVSEEDKTVAITETTLWSGMATRVHRPLKFIALNANCIGRQRYDLSK
jgi:hypothetical protein